MIFGKVQQKCASLLRSSGRKVTFSILAFLVLMYFASSWIRRGGRRYIVLGRQDRCIEDNLLNWNKAVSLSDAFTYRKPKTGEQEDKYFLPYVGNGYIGISIDGNHGVWLKGDRGLDIATDFNPLGHFSIKDFASKQATVLDVKGGKIVRYRCFENPSSNFGKCISLQHKIYAHRTRPGLLVQDMLIHNPTDRDLEMTISQDSISEWATESTKVEISNTETLDGDANWLAGSKTLDSSLLLTVTGMQFSASGILELKAKSTLSVRSHTMFDYVSADAKLSSSDTISARKAHTTKALERALKLGKDMLDAEHEKAWNEIWQSGFTISRSKAPEALNADVINSTLYYILSHVHSVMSAVTSSEQEKAQAIDRLSAPESCYNHQHHTLLQAELYQGSEGTRAIRVQQLANITNDQFDSLWQIGDTVESMNHGVDTHLKSLEKYGCSNHIKAGAEGVLQAVILSLGGLKFSTKDNIIVHLEFNADPADLHRDYKFQNIRYGNLTTVNISVIVDEENFPVLHVSAASTGLFACDAALKDPKPLGVQPITFPVLLTKPLTSILYISHDQKHFGELKQVVQHIEIPKLAPAHDHRVIARHKHGHSYGGLPVAFWVILVLLIVIFHAFLFKMVFTEYFNPPASLPMSMTYRKRTFS